MNVVSATQLTRNFSFFPFLPLPHQPQKAPPTPKPRWPLKAFAGPKAPIGPLGPRRPRASSPFSTAGINYVHVKCVISNLAMPGEWAQLGLAGLRVRRIAIVDLIPETVFVES